MKRSFLAVIPSMVRKVIKIAIDVCELKSYKLYAVGGAVRDYFMSIPPQDVDIVVEGNGIDVATEINRKLNFRVIKHPRFLTATVILPTGSEVDISTARREVYRMPAILPEVSPATIEEDLMRRDFTINSLALSLNPRDYLKVIDPYGGIDDIKKKIIRVLHSSSFIDDPTRAFRAIRYMTRFGFRLDKKTEYLLRSAIEEGVFERLTASRIYNEVKLILSEVPADRCIYNLKRFKLLDVFYEGLSPDRLTMKAIKNLSKIHTDFLEIQKWRPAMIAILSCVNSEDLDIIFKKYPATKEIVKAVRILPEFRSAIIQLKNKRRNSEIYNILQPYSEALILYGLAYTNNGTIRRKIIKYLRDLKNRRVLLNGDDLKRAGIKPGPEYREILTKVQDLYLDGILKDKSSAIRWVKKNYS